VSGRVKPSFVIFDIRALWRSGTLRMLYSCTHQGRSQEFVLEGTKEWVPSPAWVQTGTETRVGSGANPRNPKICWNLIECHKLHTVWRKIFQRGIFGGGHVPLVPLSLRTWYPYGNSGCQRVNRHRRLFIDHATTEWAKNYAQPSRNFLTYSGTVFTEMSRSLMPQIERLYIDKCRW